MLTRHRRLYVVTGAAGRRFAVARERGKTYVVDDLDENRRLGEIVGDLMPFVVDIGTPHLVFAGPQTRGHQEVVIESHDGREPRPPQTCRVRNGVWLSFPEPFTPGMRIAATWYGDDGRELFRRESAPLDQDALGPLFGPDWTTYAATENE